MKRLCVALALAGCIGAPLASPQEAPATGTTSIEELEAVLVIGERPGPALWKVTSRNGNALWILPVYGPLPDGLVLRSTQLETVISQAQEVHFLTQVNAPRYAANDERARQAYRNADSRLLQDLMPADLYAQFQDLNDRYGGSSPEPQMYRPIAAVDWLRQAAMQRLRLTSDRAVIAAVNQLAMNHGVPTFSVKMKRDEVWDEMIERLGKTPREADVPCAQERLGRLERNLQESVARANAWSRGDVAALRDDPGLQAAQTEGAVCRKYFRDIDVGVVQQKALRRYSYSSARKWLKNNRSTLVLVPISSLFESDGLVARLKRAGYKVEAPPALAEARPQK